MPRPCALRAQAEGMFPVRCALGTWRRASPAPLRALGTSRRGGSPPLCALDTGRRAHSPSGALWA